MRQSEVINWYSRKDVASELVRVGQDREVAHMFRQGSYGKRPSILQFPADVKTLARQGVTSLHISEERWKNPMNLHSETSERELNDLRKSWDLIIDIDCPFFEYSTIAAETIVEALKFHGVKNPSVKFSGNRGWHIGVPAESFPEKIGNKHFKELFPGATKAIASYLQFFIDGEIKDKLIKHSGDIKNIAKKLGKKKEDIFPEGGLEEGSPKGSKEDLMYKASLFADIIGIDIQVGAPRHLIRAPYSLHEKTWLVSLPIETSEIKDFKKNQAKPENIKNVRDIFFNRELIKKGEAYQLLVQALDWGEQKHENKVTKEYSEIEGRISDIYFPPCINHILKGGMSDGRKRALFAIINFLKMMNWSWDEIEEKVREWNSTNSPQLKEGYVRTQLKWHNRQHRKFPPPNCGDYYYNIGVPLGTCKDHKNPVSYAVRKVRK